MRRVPPLLHVRRAHLVAAVAALALVLRAVARPAVVRRQRRQLRVLVQPVLERAADDAAVGRQPLLDQVVVDVVLLLAGDVHRVQVGLRAVERVEGDVEVDAQALADGGVHRDVVHLLRREIGGELRQEEQRAQHHRHHRHRRARVRLLAVIHRQLRIHVELPEVALQRVQQPWRRRRRAGGRRAPPPHRSPVHGAPLSPQRQPRRRQ
mmetsp:Transcript_14575/g.50790  ORF Transcript_14575/g.50790 Transcript_14575/m.50790 type:complete len:208 (+) Transcript_14575:672-1295(+)